MAYLINLEHHDDARGSLTVIDKVLPFEIKRIYYTYQVPNGEQRGGHAHKDLSQILFCPYGQIRVI